jgi:Carboxypeptidase regulatory-like domain
MASLSLQLFLLNVAAQTSRVGASVEGTVSDRSGAAIAGSQVTLRNSLTNQSRMVRTNAQGWFRSEQLPVGTYEVQVDQTGFGVHATGRVGDCSMLRNVRPGYP